MQDFKGTAPQAEAGHVHNAQAGSAAPYSPRRRITANSFKLLTARLQSKEPLPDLFEPPSSAQPPPEPDANAATQTIATEVVASLPDVVPEPEPYVEARPSQALPEQQEAFEPPSPGFSLPVFVPLNEQYTESNRITPPAPTVLPEPVEVPAPDEQAAAADELEAKAPVEEPEDTGLDTPTGPLAPSLAQDPWPVFAAIGELPVAEPLPVEPEAPAEPDDLNAEPAPGIAEISAEPELASDQPPEAISLENPEHAPDAPSPALASAAPGDEERPATQADITETESPPRASSPLAEKVVEALIKTVTEAVYAKPSASERAAFLRDIAELVENSETTGGETAVIAPEPVLPRLPIAPEICETQETQPLAPSEEAATITQVIADRLGPSSPILRKVKEQDPFAQAKSAGHHGADALQEADEDTGELALSLLDMMSGGAAASQPQERALAADTLLRLVPRIPSRQLLAISERVAIMEAPPSLLVAKLIRDNRHEIAAPLLERCMHITDQDLATATAEGDVHKLRMIARRRAISPTLSDQLIDRGDTSVILTLVRNPGAALNHDSYFRLAEHAIDHHAVLAPLATRGDLPAPVAFELFWHVPHELRRFLLSRFLTDSENLNRILKITMATQAPVDGAAAAEPKFPPQEQLEMAIAHVTKGELESGAQILADAAGIAVETVLRALADRDGEPVAVLLKTLGFQRSRFSTAVASLQNADISLLNPSRKVEELQSIYDTLSFNKARILLTYWDWYTRKAGPYAPHN